MAPYLIQNDSKNVLVMPFLLLRLVPDYFIVNDKNILCSLSLELYLNLIVKQNIFRVYLQRQDYLVLLLC